ncbi:serine hydrolase domain-containing protein [Chitinimonas viridis]|uniref:Serine hydrolase domain-containing protein n=1 Tax=Chitinimonas viridis TaxID=664880 RepID=A0ABT8B9S9_9NEIS|nr:serine hydrolase domain-containing protein [Chitinimonas viridis]MDN3578560.1 serine hydrolase domain-containing protein [Chitinimonas viridis]
MLKSNCLVENPIARTVALCLVPLALLSACNGNSAKTNVQASLCAAKQPGASAKQIKACEGDLPAKVDKAMQGIQKKHGVTAATISIMHDGRVLHEQGYGFLDATHRTPLPANALFVTASIIKPVTAAAIHKLAAARQLSLDDKVFCTVAGQSCWLPVPLSPEEAFDPRLKDITISHLLAHQGGWDASVSGDAFIAEAVIQAELGLNAPAQQEDITRWMVRRPLDYQPGSQMVYSNFGYMLLGRIIEQASKTAYVDYVYGQILQPMGIPREDFKPMASRLKDHDPREPNYLTTLQVPSVFEPGKMVSALDGAVRAENWQSTGLVISTAHAMAAFAGKYEAPSGLPLAGKTHNGGHTGAVPGLTTVMRQLPSGISFAVMLNTRDELHSDGPGSVEYSALYDIENALKEAGL